MYSLTRLLRVFGRMEALRMILRQNTCCAELLLETCMDINIQGQSNKRKRGPV